MGIDRQSVALQFEERFGRAPKWVVRAPGRVNLIGEHTDYNDGFVLPLAIDRAVWIALAPRDDARVAVYSIDYKESREFDLASLTGDDGALNNGGQGWIEYIKGTAWSLQDAGYRLRGWEGVLQGDVPLGAGLSSSAALEMATARAFALLSRLKWDPARMALLGQRAENRWVGVNCGIMDQLISAAGKEGHALLIDCRTLDTMPVPLPSNTAVVVLDTGTRRGLVDSAYNERRRQCESAAAFFGVKALRDATLSQFMEEYERMEPVVAKRARHVISENQRTMLAGEAMRRGDAALLGRLMDESHASLRDDYGVSSDALNTMVGVAKEHAACIGARMTGAGFGGCAVALVRADAAAEFAATTAEIYRQKTRSTPTVYVCHPSAGASEAT